MFKTFSDPDELSGPEPSRHPAGKSEHCDKRRTHTRTKRVADFIVCLGAAPAVLLTVAVAMVLIAITMGRPIFFAQPRVGLNGRVFKMLKLRTMRPAPVAAPASTATRVGDPRITKLGQLLRRTHIDELPQVWNILRGDMTLIGPRPEQPHFVDYYRTILPDYDRRHTVAPGLSGWAQVRYGYAADAAETSVKLRYDLHYLDNFGLKIDLMIVFYTLFIFMNRKYVR